jgi:hypothetical protein
MPMARRNRDRIHQIANWLREEFPPPFPVKVLYCKLDKEVIGDTSKRGSKFILRIDSSLSRGAALDVLLHEWGHVISWTFSKTEQTRAHHSDEWALAYGRIYRSFHDEFGYILSRDCKW